MTDLEARTTVADAITHHFTTVMRDAGLHARRQPEVVKSVAAFTNTIIDLYLKCLMSEPDERKPS